MRQRRADGADVREDVDLERAQPVVVVSSSNDACRAVPTLLTRTSRPPKRSTLAATASAQPAAAPRSTSQPSTSGAPSARSASTARGQARGSRPAMATDAPARASPRADRQPDAGAAAGDQCATAAETEIHGGKGIPCAEDAHAALRTPRRDGRQPGGALAGARRPAPQRHRRRPGGARSRRSSRGCARRHRGLRPGARPRVRRAARRAARPAGGGARGLREIDVGSWPGLDRRRRARALPRGRATATPRAARAGPTARRTTSCRCASRAPSSGCSTTTRTTCTIAVFVHGGVIRALAALALGLDARTARRHLGTAGHTWA